MSVQVEIIKQTPTSASHPTPLLFIHGAWHAAWCWNEHFLSYFAEHGYRSYALSLRGHGASDGHQQLPRTRFRDYIEDVEQVINQLEALPVVIGHSMGGFIVQKLMETHNLPAAILLAPSPRSGIFVTVLSLLRRKPLAYLKGTLLFALNPFLGLPPLIPNSYFSLSLPTWQRQKYTALLQPESFQAILDTFVFDLSKPRDTNIPMLVLGSSLDIFVPPKTVKATARLYKAENEILENVSHDMMLDTAWEEVAEKIVTWLKQRGI